MVRSHSGAMAGFLLVFTKGPSSAGKRGRQAQKTILPTVRLVNLMAAVPSSAGPLKPRTTGGAMGRSWAGKKEPDRRETTLATLEPRLSRARVLRGAPEERGAGLGD